MSGYSVRQTEASELSGSSITTTTGTVLTDAIDLSRARRWVVTLIIPTLSGGATVDFAITASATSTGSYTAVTGTSIAQEAVGGKVYRIEFTTDAITNANSTYKWIKGRTIVGTATAGNVCAAIEGFQLRFEPGVDQAAGAGTAVNLG